MGEHPPTLTTAEAALTVSDEGRGIDPGAVEPRRSGGGQGLELIRGLAGQLGGDVEQGAPGRAPASQSVFR